MSDLISARLKKDSNFNDLEELADKISKHSNIKLQIPNSLAFNGAFGIEGAALQVIANWLRLTDHTILHTSVSDSNNPELFEELCNSLLGLTSLRLADEIITNRKEVVSLQTALTPAIMIFKKIRKEQYKEAFKGMYLTIPSIKAKAAEHSRNREFDSPLYNNSEVIGSEKFMELTSEAISSVLPKSAAIKLKKLNVTKNISEIIRELFTNTHRHARADIYGNPYNKNFRAIIFNNIDLSEERVLEISESPSSAMFFGEWLPKKGSHFRALDITIVDSGPGYARKWCMLEKHELTLEQERNSIVECFKKHRSSDPRDSSGSGLSNVLKDLKKLKGWMRLRTGRTLVEKAFFDSRGEPSIQLKDVKEKEIFMEGVAFNIVIPIEALASM